MFSIKRNKGLLRTFLFTVLAASWYNEKNGKAVKCGFSLKEVPMKKRCVCCAVFACFCSLSLADSGSR